jgi:hypothetical protein
MTQQPGYKTRKDGSIDYGYYITRSHELRSRNANSALRSLKRAIVALIHTRPNWQILKGVGSPA